MELENSVGLCSCQYAAATTGRCKTYLLLKRLLLAVREAVDTVLDLLEDSRRLEVAHS